MRTPSRMLPDPGPLAGVEQPRVQSIPRRRAPKEDTLAFRGIGGLDRRIKRAARELGLAGYGELLRTITERFLRAHEGKQGKRDTLLDLADSVRSALQEALADGRLDRAEVEIITDQIVELVAGVRKRRRIA